MARGYHEDRTKIRNRKAYRILAVLVLFLCLVVGILYMTFSRYYYKLNVQETGSVIRTMDLKSDEILLVEEKNGTDLIDKTAKELSTEKTAEPSENLTNEQTVSDKDVHNILLIGVDNDYKWGMDARGNADGLIIMSINQKTKQIVLSSLMRDIDVVMASGGHTKLTLTYHEGGTQGLIDAIESNFAVPIDNYILVNYLNIIDIVDAFGGITVDVTSDELFWMQEKIVNLNELAGYNNNDNLIPPENAGTVTLNGIQTAAYMRIRYAGNGDYERTERIRRVLIQLKDKAMSMSLGEMNRMANVVLPCIQTDLSQSEVLNLTIHAFQYLKYEIVSNRIPIEGTYYETEMIGSEVVIDFKANNEFLYATIYEGHEP